MIKSYKEEVVELIPKNELDLLVIYHITTSITDITMLATIYWQEKQESGRKNVRLSRRKMYVELQPYNVHLSEDIRSVRITGYVKVSYPEKFLKGRKIGITVNVGDKVIFKRIPELDKVLSYIPEETGKSLIIFVLDMDSYIVAKVDNDLSVVNQRRYQYSKHLPSNQDEKDKFKEDVLKDLLWAIEEKKKSGCAIVVGVNIISKKYLSSKLARWVDLIVEGDFEGDLTGLIQLIRHSKVREMFGDNYYINKLVVHAESLAKLERGEVLYGFEEVSAAIKYNTAKRLILVTDIIFEKPELIELIVTALKKKINVSIMGKSDYGYYMVKRYGGIVALF